MQTLQNRIEDLIGPISTHANIDDSALKDFLESSAKEIIDILPNQMLIPYSETANFTADKSDAILNSRLLLVTRVDPDGISTGVAADVEAIQKPLNLKSKVLDSKSIHYATKISPVFIIGNDGDITIYPTTTDNGTIYYYPYPAIDIAQTYIGSAVKKFPETAHYAVILNSAIKCMQSIINDLIHTEEDVDLVQAVQVELASLQNLYQKEIQRFTV